MSEAKRDQNFVPGALGVSSADSTTTLPFKIDSVTGRLYVDLAGGSGTVTSVSVVSANGFAGTVATATTTPAITLSTTITGVLKGNGTTISAATNGTDYLSSTTGLKLDQTSAQTISVDSPIFNSLTASELVATTAAKKLQSLAVATYPSLTEISYVKGVTSAIQTQINAKGAGTVTSVSVTTVNGVSGTVATDTTTPAISLTLGAITPTTVNGNTLTTGSSTYTGTAAAVYTFPGATKTIAANDGSNWTIASQAIGDIAYASSTTAYTRLAAVATGSVLVSAGTGTAPAYSANPQVTTVELGHATDTTLSRSAAGTLAVEGIRVITTTPLVVSAASYTTDTGTSLNMDNLDQFIITAQAGALLFNAPGGTLVQGRSLVIRIKDNATARALTWNAVFRAMGTALPSTTVLSKTLYLGFFYNSTDTKWDLVASAQEA